MSHSTNDQEPIWLTVRVIATTEYCCRAAIVMHEQGSRDVQDVDDGPRLDFLPDFTLELLESRRQSVIDGIVAAFIGMGVVIVGIGVASVLITPVFLISLPLSANWCIRWFRKRFEMVALLTQRIREAKDAQPLEPIVDSTDLQLVTWWSLLRAGFMAIQYEEAHDDPQLRFTGKPWRVLHKDSLRIPVFLKRSGKRELHTQQLVRMAAYCHLLEVCEGGKSPYGVVIFANGYEGTTVPFTTENRQRFVRTVERTRLLLEERASNSSTPDAPTSKHCRACPFGLPRVFDPGSAASNANSTGVYLTRGEDKRLYHSACGDRFRWVPPHAIAKAKKLL